MRIACSRCGCPIDIPTYTPPGAPLLCPRCGNTGAFNPPPRHVPATPKRSKSPAALILLGILVSGCIGSIFAVALPWPTIAMSLLLLAGGVVVISGRIGREWRVRWPLGIGAVLVSVWLVGLGSLRLVGEYEEASRREAEATAAAQAEERRQNELRQQAPERIANARRHLEGAQESIQNLNAEPMQLAAQQLEPLADLDPAPDGYQEVRDQVRELNAQLARLGAQRFLDQATEHADAGRWAEARTALGNAGPFITALGAEGTEYQTRQTELQQRGGPHWAALAAIQQGETALEADHADAIASESAYDTALASLGTIEGEALDANAREIRRLRRRLERARRRNHRAAERLRRDRAARAAQRQRCGERPLVGGWDGELVGAERYVASSAHDPDSIDVEHCTVPSLTVNTSHCWVTTCDVLGRNAFGAMIRNRMQFEVRGGRIISGRRVR